MAGVVYRWSTRRPYGIISALCLLSLAASAPVVAAPAVASAQPISRPVEQQRRAQAEFREALEQSERRIAAAQAEQIRNAQERSEQQRRAQAEADRKREAEQRKEEFLAQARAQVQQPKPPQPPDALPAPQVQIQEAATAPVSMPALEALPRRYLLMRQIGLAVMIGASIGALFVLGRIVQERQAR